MTSETSLRSQNFCLQERNSLASLRTVDLARPSMLPRSQKLMPAYTSYRANRGIIVSGSGRLIVRLGVDDLVIVNMLGTLMIATRARSQEVKRLFKKGPMTLAGANC